MNSSDFISTDHILGEVLATVNDTELKKGFSKGWYISRIQDAVRQLAYETRFFKVQKDYAVPSNCQIKIPEGVFNIREIYLYNGTICDPIKSQVVYWKRTFNNNYSGNGYTARVKDDGSQGNDLFQPNHNWRNGVGDNFRGTKYYYNTIDGIIMLSKSCDSYPNIRIIFNGDGCAVGDIPIIPSFFERAVVDFVEERFWNAMKSRDPRKYRILWADAKAVLDSFTGNWAKAKKMAKGMDTAQKESMDDYQSNMLHK